MSTALRLSVVTSEMPDPPYPADTKANGWKPEVDIQRLKQSRTWVLCPQSYRPWLLMLWIESWESIPAGTYPADDDEMIAARIGMDPDDFLARRKALMRGWVRHSDDLLYHPYITVQVLQMIGGRSKTAERQRRFREANDRRAADAVTRDKNDVTRDKNDVTRQSHVSNGQEQEQEQEQEKKELIPPTPPARRAAWTLPAGIDPDLWAEFEAHRHDIRKPMSDAARTKNAAVLLALDREQQRAAVDATIASRWVGLFPPKVTRSEQRSSAGRKFRESAEASLAAHWDDPDPPGFFGDS